MCIWCTDIYANKTPGHIKFFLKDKIKQLGINWKAVRVSVVIYKEVGP